MPRHDAAARLSAVVGDETGFEADFADVHSAEPS